MLRPRTIARAAEIECRAQIERLQNAGVHLTHADSHQHLHAFPPAFRCAVKLCREYGIPALRRPRERGAANARRADALALGAALAFARAVARPASLRHNDHFLGFRRAGAYGLAELRADLSALRHGLTELALHPSKEDGMPYPRLRGNRERLALLDASFRDLITQSGVELTTWEEATR